MQYLNRLKAEITELSENPVDNCSAGPMGDKLDEWEAVIAGPKDTPYENGVFKLSMVFTKDYPFKPPKVKFITPIYHCNIDRNGNICLSILKDNGGTDGWTPALTIGKILLSICSLLSDPNPGDPLEPDIANHYNESINSYNAKAREHTTRYAC